MLAFGLVAATLVGCDSDDGDKPRAEPAGQSAEKQQPADGAGSAARRGPVRLLRLGSFDAPTFLAAPHGDKRRFVVQRGGTIVIVRGRRTLGRPFLDISDGVSTDGEGGLLSKAFCRSTSSAAPRIPIAPTSPRAVLSCACHTSAPTTRAASSSSAPTACCTSGSVTEAVGATPTRTR